MSPAANKNKNGKSTGSTKKKDILGILLVFLATILLFAFLTGGKSEYVGTFGKVFAGGLLSLLGFVCYIIPVILIKWAVSEFHHKKIEFRYSLLAGLILIAAGGTVLFHLISPGAGGSLGDFLSDVIIQSLFGNIGAYIFSITILTVSLILIFDLSVKHVSASAGSFMAGFRKKLTSTRKPAAPEMETGQKAALKKAKAAAREKKKEAKKEQKSAKKPRKLKKDDSPETRQPEAVPVPPPSAGLKDYSVPLDLLADQPDSEDMLDEEEERGERLREVLANFDISAEICEIQVGPAITRYEMTLPPGIKLSRIRNLSSNIAMALEAKTVRLLTPIPGKSAVGVEVPALKQETVSLKTMIASDVFHNEKSSVPYCLGKSVDGDLKVVDIARMPHLLLAGATGSGKSVAIHALINSILFKSSPDSVKLLLMDPKRVELPVYNGIPHLASDVITEAKKAVDMLEAVTKEMDDRYDMLAKRGVADIDSYNRKASSEGWDRLVRLVVVIDELADLMVMAKDKVERTIVRIAQMARAVGIHLVLATQRPSVDVITGIIKANLPARIAFNVLSGVDSRTILDSNGAEKLLGRGDMLYLSSELPQPERIQGSYIDRKEVERVVKYLQDMNYDWSNLLDIEEKAQDMKNGSDYEDDLYPEAVQLVIRKKKASISYLQRRLRIGYNRAARIIDRMEDNGIIGEEDGSKGRPVLVSEEYLEKLQ